jgi:hypothetical protein
MAGGPLKRILLEWGTRVICLACHPRLQRFTIPGSRRAPLDFEMWDFWKVPTLTSRTTQRAVSG